jgi:transcriptional regulator with XRE-family HTH domain
MLRNIGKALAMTRQQSGMSQYQLAVRCRIGRSQISKYEAGREIMKLDTLEKLLTALNIEPEHFFRFVRSLDETFGAQRRPRGHGREPALEEAFQNLHFALDKLRQAVERSLQAGTARSPTPAAGPIPGEVPDSPLRRVRGYKARIGGRSRT